MFYLFKGVLSEAALGKTATHIDQLCPWEFADGCESTLITQQLVYVKFRMFILIIYVFKKNIWYLIHSDTGTLATSSVMYIIHPIQVTASSGGYIVLHTAGVAVIWICLTWGRFLWQVDIVYCCKGSPHFCLDGEKQRFGLPDAFHF